jgi:hypothetical protein
MGHFYHPKTGELIDGNLREARKVSGLPSPTTVLGILSSPGLQYYFKRSMWEAARTTPRHPDWTDDQDFEECMKWMNEHGQAARDKGGDFHSLVQRFHEMQMRHGNNEGIQGSEFAKLADPSLAPQFAAYTDWYFKNIYRSRMVEQAVIGHRYAGRVDHVAEMMDGRIGCLDVKTQDITKKKKFTYYSNWAVQLGAYAGACKPMPNVLISVAVSSNLPAVVEAYEWPKNPEYYHDIFLGLLKYWCLDNDYHPT